jgi:solute carrier family 25 citrate transporter 1
MKQGSNQGLRFMWFNEYKQIMTNNGEKPLTPFVAFFGGMSAGCFSTLGNNPFDVIKVRRIVIQRLGPSLIKRLTHWY